MIKRTIEISRQPAHLSAKLEQLIVQPFDQDATAARSIPAEDIGLVMVDQPRSSFSYHALVTLMRHGAAFVVCGPDHLPLGMMLPLPDHTEVVWRIDEQIAVTKPTKKRLWQQLVREKVKAQARNLSAQSPAYRQMHVLADEVKTDDSTNIEGQAARLYWSAWLADAHTPRLASSRTAQTGVIDLDGNSFRRDPNGLDPLNAMLNYGYSVLRAAVGRALVSTGLLPAIGIKHRNRSNNFCLADDLMEPLRPLVDARVRQLYFQGRQKLDQPTKAELLEILTMPVRTNGQTGPLMVSLSTLTASLVKCFQGSTKALTIPLTPPSANER